MAHTNLPVRLDIPTRLVPVPVPVALPSSRGSLGWGAACGLALAVVLGVGLLALRSWGAGAAKPMVYAAPLIVAEPWISTPVPIQVGPLEVVPKRAWIRIAGLPTLASLSEGHAIARGSWHVPLDRLLGLAITAPSGEGIRFGVNVALMSPRGAVLSEVDSMLVVMAASRLFPTSGHTPSKSQTAPEATCPEMAAPRAIARAELAPVPGDQGARRHAEGLVQSGNRKLAEGSVAAARLFYQRAAEMGWWPGAFALGITYDPSENARAPLPGFNADLLTAQCWYAKARELEVSATALRTD
jgi:hypothetical protein